MRIYIAGSFAYKSEQTSLQHKELLSKASQILRDRNIDVYLPQENQITNAWDYPNNEWGLMVFSNDISAINQSDVVVMLTWGKQDNHGSAWECGYAFASGKKVIVVAMNDDVQSIMLLHGSYAQLKGLDELKRYDFSTMPKSRLNQSEES